MQAKYKKIIYDTIKDLTKLPKEKIIMNYNDKAMPTGDFCRIHFGEISSDDGDTGIEWFRKNFNKIKFQKNDSSSRNKRIDFINLIFIHFFN